MQMITISLCMIVKNEERILARCLDSVKDLVDEIIIVDTGSADGFPAFAADPDASYYGSGNNIRIPSVDNSPTTEPAYLRS